jgi:hypothetical protein
MALRCGLKKAEARVGAGRGGRFLDEHCQHTLSSDHVLAAASPNRRHPTGLPNRPGPYRRFNVLGRTNNPSLEKFNSLAIEA